MSEIMYKGVVSFLSILIVSTLTSCGGGGGSNSSAPDNSNNQNTAPSISGSITKIRVGANLDFYPSAYDAENDNLTFSISGKPNWASFESSSGRLYGIPGDGDLNSTYSITITVSDGQLTDSISFTLSVISKLFYIMMNTDSLDEFREMDISLTGCLVNPGFDECADETKIITISDNGTHGFNSGIETGSPFYLEIDRHPGRQECHLEQYSGTIQNSDQSVDILCESDLSAPLFNLDTLHQIRLTIDESEWQRFVLDTERARYTNGDANGVVSEWNSWTHSEVYRQLDFEYLDENGNVIDRLDNVGFKMRGNTSRQWPEYWFQQSDGDWTVKPRRFSFGIKFDEEFDEDESVYSCINSAGQPAPVDGHPCNNRVGKNLAEIIENDGREFMDLDKVFFRFNRDDPSYQRELLAHDILNSIGVPASRVAHANITLRITGNGTFYGQSLPREYKLGVFQMVEQIDEPFVERYFGRNGFLFKIGGNADLADWRDANPTCVPYESSTHYEDPNFCMIGVEKSDPKSREEWLGTANYMNPSFVNSDINDSGEESQFKPYRPIYDLKTKKNNIVEGREKLQNFMSFLQSMPSAVMLEEQFDVPGFIKAQAAEITMGAVDHYVRVANNYYLYFNPIKNKWIYMVNDFDFVFRDSHDLSNGSPSWFSAFRDIANTYAFPSPGKVDWAQRELGSVNPILWDIIFSEQANKDLLYEEIKSILDNQFTLTLIQEKILARNALVEEAIRDTEAGLPDGCGFIYNNASLDSEDTGCDYRDISIKKFVEMRRETLYQELQENGF